jgi:hypothetical protein
LKWCTCHAGLFVAGDVVLMGARKA